MISISSEQKLAILLPNTNKALSEVIKNASADELKQLSKHSDIKSLLSSLFNENINSTKSDKTLLDILKNSTVFKDMGSFSKDLNSLQSAIESEKLPKNIQESLSKFTKGMDSIDFKLLKSQINNSGVFLESKLAKAVEPKKELHVILKSIQTELKNSTRQEAKQILNDIKTVLQSIDNDKKAPISLKELTQNITKLQTSIKELHVKADIITSNTMQKLLDTLQMSITQDKIPSTKSIIPQIYELHSLVLQSKNPVSSSILGALEKIVTLLKTTQDNPDLHVKDTTIKSDIQKVIDKLHVSIKNVDSAFSKEIFALKDKLSNFTKIELFSPKEIVNERIVHDMKANLLHLNEDIKQIPSLQNSEISKLVDKLTLQIDYYQLYSHLNNSSSIYFPFVWDELQEGSLNIKKVKEDRFYCEINLNLKDYGELKVMLSLFDKNQINVHAFSESKKLKNALRESVSLLRSAFIEADLTLRDIRFFDKQIDKKERYQESVSDFDMGFEVKV